MGFLDKLLGPPKPDQFAQMFMAALRKAGDQRKVRFNPEEFRLEYEGNSGISNSGRLN